jgi:hypothetical protein
MIKRYKIPTVIGIVVLVLATFVGVYFLRSSQIFRIGASATATPKDVRTSNLSDTSATLSWLTGSAANDFINWGSSQNSLGNTANESGTNQKFFTHSITLTGLKPDTTYYFDINSEGTNFENNGLPWQFATGDTVSINQNSNPISGSVITSSGQPSKRALIYVDVEGYTLSTLTSDSGNFVLQLSNARTTDLKQIAQIDNAQTLLTVSVQADDGETSSAQIFPQSANPIPPLVLGQVEDYRSLQPVQNGENPNLNLNLPAGTTQESKFNVSTSSGSTKPTSVILESLNEGEVINSNQPQFFGKGPGGETITITVHSEDVPAEVVQIPATGSWSYSLPAPLSDGPHSITVSWLDSTGITRTLTRDFVVQAGEMPAFVATPSATPTTAPTVGHTPTPVPTLIPTPTPLPTITATPVITPTASPESMPVTGDLTPTLLLSIMGIAIMAFSFFIWKMSEN